MPQLDLDRDDLAGRDRTVGLAEFRHEVPPPTAAHDDFFALGGHPTTSSRARRAVEADVSPRDLVDARTAAVRWPVEDLERTLIGGTS